MSNANFKTAGLPSILTRLSNDWYAPVVLIMPSGLAKNAMTESIAHSGPMKGRSNYVSRFESSPARLKRA